MGFRAILFDKLDHQLSIRRLDLGDKRDINGARTGSVDVLEFGPLGFCVGLGSILFESGRMRGKMVVRFVENWGGDVQILQDPAVVPIQSPDSET